MIYSKPKFLYENYQNCLDIANENSEKSFVYVYDNFFNHMQSIPEMMIYEKTLIFNYNNDELRCIVDDENLNNEGSFVLSIKAYMDNDKILNEIKDNSDFKNITLLYEGGNEDGVVNNNYYLVSK
ncbi:unknown [Clostridium sp. CAG:575]|nr:unknown [Clostridium sp. CAG:575]